MRLEGEIDDLLLPYKVDLSLIHQIESRALLEHIRRVGKIIYQKKREAAAKNKVSRNRIQKSRQTPKSPPASNPPIHPWRVCPYGQHQVIEHPRNNSPSKSHPDGSVSNVHWHCAHNPSGKDQLYPDEIREIATRHFSGLRNRPCPISLGFPNGSKYDDLIAGWVQYWSEVLKPSQPLDPNLVKALIASESSFNPKKINKNKDPDSARGLMQITNDARKLLDDDTELKDHQITATKKDLDDPCVNICAGVRWLFRKREIASIVRLKRQATWIEAAEEYKGDLEGLLKGNKKSRKDVAPFLKYLREIDKCRK